MFPMLTYPDACGRKATWRHLLALLSHHTGHLRVYTAIDWARVDRLIMICTGNICRSPYAEYRARALGIPAISFGLKASPGSLADDSAVRNAAGRGIDLTTHRSRISSDVIFSDSDLLITMEPKQADAVLRDERIAATQVTILGLWAAPPRPYIHDPHASNDACFQRCYAVIDRSLLAIASRMNRYSESPGTHPAASSRPYGVSRRTKGA